MFSSQVQQRNSHGGVVYRGYKSQIKWKCSSRKRARTFSQLMVIWLIEGSRYMLNALGIWRNQTLHYMCESNIGYLRGGWIGF